MQSLFAAVSLIDVQRNLLRNIVSQRGAQDAFDDLSDDPSDWRAALQAERDVQPPTFASSTPVIHRPFEASAWFTAIFWPFQHWQASRFSDGSHGVWYGADTLETSVHESAYHWYHGLLRDAGFERERVVGERQVYAVHCSAALLDFRAAAASHPKLLHRTDYRFAQGVGARIHREGHPGLVIPSVRRPAGETLAVFNPAVLSDVRLEGLLTYRLDGTRISVEKQPGKAWLKLDAAAL